MSWMLRSGVFAGALACALGATSTVAEAAEFTWRFDIFTGESRPESRFAKEFADRIFERSKGRLELKPFYGESLGIKQADHLRALKNGSVEIMMVAPVYYGRDQPDLPLLTVQGVVRTPEEMAMLAPVIKSAYPEAFARWGGTVVGHLAVPYVPISVFCHTPVSSFAELKSKKLRVWSRDQVDAFGKLGIAAQIVPQGDMYTALQTGVVDCALHGIIFTKSLSLQEVVKYATPLHAFVVAPQGIVVADRYWKALPKDLQDIVKEAGAWIWEKSEKLATDPSYEANARKELLASGEMKGINEAGFPAADQQALYEAASAVWKERAEQVGRNAPKYREMIMKALEEYRRTGKSG